MQQLRTSVGEVPTPLVESGAASDELQMSMDELSPSMEQL
jgi:hypothetical protein